MSLYALTLFFFFFFFGRLGLHGHFPNWSHNHSWFLHQSDLEKGLAQGQFEGCDKFKFTVKATQSNHARSHTAVFKGIVFVRTNPTLILYHDLIMKICSTLAFDHEIVGGMELTWFKDAISILAIRFCAIFRALTACLPPIRGVERPLVVSIVIGVAGVLSFVDVCDDSRLESVLALSLLRLDFFSLFDRFSASFEAAFSSSSRLCSFRSFFSRRL